MTSITKPKNQWKRVLKIFIPYILTVGIFQAIAAYFMGIDYRNYNQPNISTFQFFVLNIVGLLGTVLIIGVSRKYVDKESFKSLGFETTYLIKDILKGLIMGFIIMAIGFLVLITFKQIQFKELQYDVSDFTLGIVLFIVVAFSEELLVRGYILSNLMASCNKYLALIISSAIFSLLHSFNPNINAFAFMDLFLSGILLGLSYIYTKNLWFPIALHFSWNFFQGTIFGFNVSGLKVYSIIRIENHQSTIWNGGVFGFEGSIFSIIFQLIAIAIIYIIFKKREIKDAGEVDSNLMISNTCL